VTVPPTLKPPLIVAESVTVEPTRGDELERLVEIEGVTLPTEIEIAIECERDPLVPETVTVNIPLAEDGQDMVEVPEPSILIGERIHKSPVDGDDVDAKVTVPAKPLTPDIVTVEFPALPTVTFTVEGLTEMLKSWTMKITVVECDLAPLVPVTVTWTVEAELNAHESVPLPEPVTVDGVTVHEVLLVARFTTPTNPLEGATLMVEVPGVPTFRITDVGLEAMAKSVTVNVTPTEWDRPLLVPVTITV
jgi:hypothetical protein